MDVNDVPQEGNRTMGGYRRAMYAKDTDGRIVIVPSRGGESENIRQAIGENPAELRVGDGHNCRAT